MWRARGHFVGSRNINFISIFQSIKPMIHPAHALSDFNFDAVGDGSFVRLYVDGSQIGSRSTSGASPDNLGI